MFSERNGKALVIDCRDLPEGSAITMDKVRKYAYFGDYPCVDDEVLDYIIAGEYKGIGFDVIGLDPIADEKLTRHKKLFAAKDIVNIENLRKLEKCGTELFWFSCCPLKLEDSDGAPIRAIAWFEQEIIQR